MKFLPPHAITTLAKFSGDAIMLVLFA